MNTIEELTQKLEQLNYKIIDFPDGFKGRCQEKLYIEDLDGYKYYMDLYHIEKGFVPEKFRKSNPFTIENIKLWLIKNNKSFKLVSENYINSHDKLEWFCLRCEKIFTASWDNIISNNGCKHCKYKQLGLEASKPHNILDSLLHQYPDIAEEWDYELNTDRPENYRPKSGKKKWWICPFCNKPYLASIAHRTKNKSGCPLCKMSHGEVQIYKFLKKHNINFIFQHSFSDCKNIRVLKFDFYLPSQNLCIEFQGKQHYYPYDFQSYSYTTNEALKKYERTIKNDNIKRKYCKDNNINLLEIPYTQIDGIENLLLKNLKLKATAA